MINIQYYRLRRMMMFSRQFNNSIYVSIVHFIVIINYPSIVDVTLKYIFAYCQWTVANGLLFTCETNDRFGCVPIYIANIESIGYVTWIIFSVLAVQSLSTAFREFIFCSVSSEFMDSPRERKKILRLL